MKIKLFTNSSIVELEREVNLFLEDPYIIVMDKSFTVESNGQTNYKYVCIWYDSINEVEFKQIKKEE